MDVGAVDAGCGIPSRLLDPSGPAMQTDKPHVADRMTPAAMASLVDTAFRCPHPLVFLDTIVKTFVMLGRHEDAAAVGWVAHLYDRKEVEGLLSLRAAWRRGIPRNPADAARRVAAPHC